MTEIIKLDLETFNKYQSQIMDILMESSTNGFQEQYLDEAKQIKYVKELLQDGYGFLVFENELIGYLISTPLSHDSLLPEKLKQNYPVNKCIYIAEMGIHKDFRRKGYGTKMIKEFMKTLEKNKWDFVFIRSWKENPPSINLYLKMGFKLSEIIKQEKIKKDRSGTFIMEKQYLIQKVKK